MSLIPGTKRAFQLPSLSKRQLAEDVDDELAFHLALAQDELRSAGLSDADARAEAVRRFGDLEYTRRYCREEDMRRDRESRHATMMQELRQDIVYALRSLRSAPGFAFAALLTLAFGIGANTAIFSVVRGVLLDPLPFPEADRIVRMWHANPADNMPRSPVSEPDFKEWRAATRSFSTLAGYFYASGGSGADLTGKGTPEKIQGTYVTEDFFPTLRVPAYIGRTFQGEEADDLGDHNVVLSYGFWQRRFNGDRSILGTALTLDDVPYTVVGVMPPSFTYPADDIDFWKPLSTIPADDIGRVRVARFLEVIGRLAPGVTQAQAHDELNAIARRTAEIEPDAKGWTEVPMIPLRESIVGEVQRPLLVLLGAVAFVLLLTCVNIASLLLARGTARQHELAVRAALGGRRSRIIRQLLTESVVLAVLGGILGIVLAYFGVSALTSIGGKLLPRASSIRVDGMMLLYALAISTVAGMIFGAIPALRATSSNLQDLLRGGSRGVVGSAGSLRNTLVIAQVALAAVLIVGAGLAMKSFNKLLHVDPGFDARNVLAVKVSLAWERHGGQDGYPAYYNQILSAIRNVPGVQVVGAAKNLPFRGKGEVRQGVVLPGTAAGAGDREIQVPVVHVTQDYFKAMGIPLRAGRVFTPDDISTAPPVWIVNETFAKTYWPNESAIGKTLRLGIPITIIGVVGDIRQEGLAEPPKPFAYVHYLQNRRSGLNIAVRTSGDPLSYAKAIREAIWSVDKDQTITSMETMSSIIDENVARPKLLASLLFVFGIMGLLLGALAIYGVLAFTVSQRRREIGVRVALGATPQSVLGMVLRQGLTLALIGVAAGIVGALIVTRVMSAVLYNVQTTDPLTFAAVIAVLLAAALLASWLPARRALRVDPMQALRYD